MKPCPYKVLVVDDDQFSIALVKGLLGKYFQSFYAASSAKAALKIFQEQNIDIVISDLMMEGSSGYDLALSIHSISPHTLLFVMSADSSIATRQKVYEYGFFDFFAKPLNRSSVDIIVGRISLVSKIVQQSLQSSQKVQNYERYLDANTMICHTDLNKVITDVNSLYCEKMGFSADELIGKTHQLIRHPKVPKKFYKKLWDTLKKEKSYSSSILNLTKERKLVFMQISIYEKHDDFDNLIGYVSFSTDQSDLYLQKERTKKKL